MYSYYGTFINRNYSDKYDIISVYCNSTFQNNIRVQAEQNFIPVIVEQTIMNNPQSTCTPSTHDGPQGDVSCMPWFNQFDRVRKFVSVPRCVLQKTGASICQLKAKKDMRCPLYKDRNGRIYNDVKKFGLEKITRNTFAFPCDSGMKCTITKAPVTRAWGFVTFLGDSFCRK